MAALKTRSGPGIEVIFYFSTFRLPAISLAGMKVLKTIRSRGSDTVPDPDLRHGLIDRTFFVPFERLKRKGASHPSGMAAPVKKITS